MRPRVFFFFLFTGGEGGHRGRRGGGVDKKNPYGSPCASLMRLGKFFQGYDNLLRSRFLHLKNLKEIGRGGWERNRDCRYYYAQLRFLILRKKIRISLELVNLYILYTRDKNS